MTTTVVWIAFGLFALFIVAGVVLRVMARRAAESPRRTVWERAGHAGITMGFLALLLLFFSFERIRLFGSRFWYLLWLAGVIVWAVFIVHYATRVLPAKQTADAVTKEKAKYLPSRNKKNKKRPLKN